MRPWSAPLALSVLFFACTPDDPKDDDTDVVDTDDGGVDTDVEDTDGIDTDVDDTDVTDTDTDGPADSDTDTSGGTETASAAVGTSGGTIALQNGAEVVVPAGALSGSVTIDVTFHDDAAAQGWATLPSGALAGVGPAMVLTPHGTTFATPVTVRVPTSLTGDSLVLLRLDDELDTTWEASGALRSSAGFVEFDVDGFSVYAVAQATGGCPCWSGGDLPVYAATHAARGGALDPRYSVTPRGGGRDTYVSLIAGSVIENLGVTINATQDGVCVRSGSETTSAVFSYAENTLTATQATVCELLLASRFKDNVDGAQLGVVSADLPLGETFTVSIETEAPGEDPVVRDLTVGRNGVIAWLPEVFPLDTVWSVEVTDNPPFAACEADTDTDMLGLGNGVIEVTCRIDSDQDGVADVSDGCPNDAEKDDPGACGCSVAEVDFDADGVADCIDGCDTDPTKSDPGQCGCFESELDADFDGAADCVDVCRFDPEKTNPGTCGCGSPDVDSDGDGPLDCEERCPDSPIKTAPGVCGCAVADVDLDTNGVTDCLDLVEVLDPLDPTTDKEVLLGVAGTANAAGDVGLAWQDDALFVAGNLRVGRIGADGVQNVVPRIVGTSSLDFSITKALGVEDVVAVVFTEPDATSGGYHIRFSELDLDVAPDEQPIVVTDNESIDPAAVLTSPRPKLEIASLPDGLYAVANIGLNFVDVTVVDATTAPATVVDKRRLAFSITRGVTGAAVSWTLDEQGEPVVVVAWTELQAEGQCNESCTNTYETFVTALALSEGLPDAWASGATRLGSRVWNATYGSEYPPVALTRAASGEPVVVFNPGTFDVRVTRIGVDGQPAFTAEVFLVGQSPQDVEVITTDDDRMVVAVVSTTGLSLMRLDTDGRLTPQAIPLSTPFAAGRGRMSLAAGTGGEFFVATTTVAAQGWLGVYR